MKAVRPLRFLGAALLAGACATAPAAPVVTSAAGANAAAIQGAVDAFRTSLGALNPNAPGSVGSGRREINWDGVPDAFSAPGNLPADFFNVNSPRGAVFSTPGSGVQVSADTTPAVAGTPVEFGNLDPSYTGLFATFSPQRLFTALDSNVTDVSFFVPGTTAPAFTTAFGAVFTDVDRADSTSLQFFDTGGASLGTFFVPAASGDETLSFLGVRFDAGERIGRVRITTGNAALGPGVVETASIDLVAMDDFLYAEPLLLQVVPEPASALLAGLALLGLAAGRRRR